MKLKRKSTVEADFTAPPQEVWNLVSDPKNADWRSDIAETESDHDGMHFTELHPNGFRIEFFVTDKQAVESYAFKMKSKSFTGKWQGEFSEKTSGGTHFRCSEEIFYRSFAIFLLSFILVPLKAVQRRYIQDLRRALSE